MARVVFSGFELGDFSEWNGGEHQGTYVMHSQVISTTGTPRSGSYCYDVEAYAYAPIGGAGGESANVAYVEHVRGAPDDEV